MNWLDKITSSLTSKPDNSRELKKGEIKAILQTETLKFLPDFHFLMYKNSCYTFQRTRKFSEFTVYETIHICFTLKDKNFACSIASRLSPIHIQSNGYNSGLINPHKDLITIKKNKNALSIDEAYYFHNGQIETTSKVVTEILKDYKKYGIPFLDKQLILLNENELIKEGIKFIKTLKIDKICLKNEIENQIIEGKYLLENITHPIFIELKEQLLKIKGQSKTDRQLIPKLSHELLELYWTDEK